MAHKMTILAARGILTNNCPHETSDKRTIPLGYTPTSSFANRNAERHVSPSPELTVDSFLGLIQQRASTVFL